jgi:tetratricopeptide (TPR) repeat protein
MAAIHDEEFLDHAQAATVLEQILGVDPGHEAALKALARHYRALNRWEDVVSTYERHLKLVSDKATRIELLLALARVQAEELNQPAMATLSYERVLEAEPEHAAALEALAKLRESAGDADAALTAIDALAAKASTPEARAEQYVRAANLLKARGDRDGAIERYKQALDANPRDFGVAAALREAYLERGDINATMQLLEREIEVTEGDRAKAKLAGEMATLAVTRLRDEQRAVQAARRAIAFDPTNLAGHTVLGDVAFKAKRYLEASAHYEVLADRAEALPRTEAVRILVSFVDALSQSGSTEKALVPMDTLLRLAPDDSAALERVAAVTFQHGAPARAAELYQDYLAKFPGELTETERALALYRLGESLRRGDKLEQAVAPLEEAADLVPNDPEPLVALARIFQALERWADVVRTKTRHLDLATGDTRIDLLIECGELAATKLNDRTQATKSFVAALEDRPDDRRILTRLMQLYSEEKDWNRLIDVVLRLAGFVEEPKQKVKYLHTAAIVAAREMGDVERALDYYEQVLDLDPKMMKALREFTELHAQRGEWHAVERLLRRELEIVSEQKDEPAMLDAFTRLGELYEQRLGDTDRAIDAFEAAQTLDADNRERALHLSELYATDPAKYLDKAVASQAQILAENPYRPESYKMLRRLYTETKQADAAWCLCQGLSVLGLAGPDEERFYKRLRSDTAAEAQDALSDEDWLRLMHPAADTLLTGLFALIEPAVIARRGTPLAELGYDSNYAIDASSHPCLLVQNLHYAAGVLGMQMPPTFENTNDPGGLLFLHTHEPSVVLGVAALNADVPPQPAAFLAARHLNYYRPGMYVRQLVPTGTGLKSWLFGAIKLIAPQFPVAPDLEGPVKEALAALDAGVTGTARDHLARIVSRLLQSGAALDLKQWVAGVDLTADRAGLLVSNDLETAVEIMKASDDSASAVASQERIKELVLFSVSEDYFVLRRKLQINLES